MIFPQCKNKHDKNPVRYFCSCNSLPSTAFQSLLLSNRTSELAVKVQTILCCKKKKRIQKPRLQKWQHLIYCNGNTTVQQVSSSAEILINKQQYKKFKKFETSVASCHRAYGQLHMAAPIAQRIQKYASVRLWLSPTRWNVKRTPRQNTWRQPVSVALAGL